MKQFNLTIIAVLFALTSFGQQAATKEKELSQADQFSAQAGTLMEKQFLDIGTVKGIAVKVLKIKDLTSGTTKSALRLEYEYKSSYTNDTKVAILDADEIDGLIK